MTPTSFAVATPAPASFRSLGNQFARPNLTPKTLELVRRGRARLRRRSESVARDLAPGDVLVHPGLAGQAEDLLAQHVAEDLAGATLDRVGPDPQEASARAA